MSSIALTNSELSLSAYRKPFIAVVLLMFLLATAYFSIVSGIFLHPKVVHCAEVKELSAQLSVSVRTRVAELDLPDEQLLKLLRELLAIEVACDMTPGYELYTLRAVKDGVYPILQSSILGEEIAGHVHLKKGEIWKVGENCCGKAKRYPKDIFFISKNGSIMLDGRYLYCKTEAEGTRMQMLIEEKMWIYTYPLLPECIARVKNDKIFLPKPPGNKIYR